MGHQPGERGRKDQAGEDSGKEGWEKQEVGWCEGFKGPSVPGQ